MYVPSKRALLMRDVILYDVVSSGFIDTSAPWVGNSSVPPIRFWAQIDDIPAVIEVFPWNAGTCSVGWVMWPGSDDVTVPRSPTDKWPGDALGIACFDRRIGLRLGDDCWMKCRNRKKQRVDAIPHLHLNLLLQEYLRAT